MKLRVQYYPTADRTKLSKFEFFVKFKYVMFPELADEFPVPFKLETIAPMNKDYDDEENVYFEVEIERPYGNLDEIIVAVRNAGATEEDQGYELRELNDAASIKQITWDIEPRPISAEM